MENRVDDTAIAALLKLEENGIRKSADKCPTIGLMDDRKDEGASLDQEDGGFNTAYELYT